MAQATPHLPQLLLSTLTLVQAPQSLRPTGQGSLLHLRLLQPKPTSHEALQAPQWASSVARFAHTPLHTARPGAQVTVQVPSEQMVPGPHRMPHAPQLKRSVWRFTQVPLHKVSDCWHEVTHAPLEHTWPWRHTVLQPP